MSSPQRLHGERSLSQRRGLVKSITSPRQLVESKGAPQSVPKFASENPQIRFRETTQKGLRKIKKQPSKKIDFVAAQAGMATTQKLNADKKHVAVAKAKAKDATSVSKQKEKKESVLMRKAHKPVVQKTLHRRRPTWKR